MWGFSAIDVFAGGESGSLVHFDGAAWTPVRVAHAEAASLTTDAWGAGGYGLFIVHGLVVRTLLYPDEF